MKNICVFLVIWVATLSSVFGTNDLTVKRPGFNTGAGTTKPAYIDNSVLVIEPHGGYAEQSLYLKYSDHGNFTGYSNVQITHRFELPHGSVINDMWLWIGDSIVQAVIVDTWKARSLYDSIVSLKLDPAFLFKNNNQYELRIFPLIGGSFRQAKINIITPVRYVDNHAIVDLPLGALKADNNISKPLIISFRYQEGDTLWGNPSITELPSQEFSNKADTLGLKYLTTNVNDITPLQSMELKYSLNFSNGRYFQSQENYFGTNYFQYSFGLKDIFHLEIDSSSKKVQVAIDLSGNFNKKFGELIPNLRIALENALGSNDSFKVKVAGAGRINNYFDQWQKVSQVNIDNFINSLSVSSFGDSVQQAGKKRITYADNDSPNLWGFSTIDSFAQVSIFNSLSEASKKLINADVCVSFRHAWLDVPTGSVLTGILDSLNVFFEHGGRFVSYFNLDCNSSENIVKHYIPTLLTTNRITENMTLYRNMDGNIGTSFPEYFDHSGANVFSYTDTTVKVEVRDALGRPAVISKKIGYGLLVVSGIWQFGDDNTTRRLLSTPLLGLNSTTNYLFMTDLLLNLKDDFLTDPYQKVLFYSNNDNVLSPLSTENWVNSYLPTFLPNPVFNTVNLLDGTVSVPSLTLNGITYNGGGYLQNYLSSKTGGVHCERQTTSWPVINSLMPPYMIPATTQMNIAVKGDNDIAKIIDFRKIRQESSNAFTPLNYVGSTIATDSVNISLNVKFSDSDSVRTVSFTDKILQPSNSSSTFIGKTLLANEKIKDLFAMTVIDTNAIVTLAVRNRILCDYSAFLALEPNDSIHFIHPLNEFELLPVQDLSEEIDSLRFEAYPNPFNSQIAIKVVLPVKSRITLRIFNILGELIKTIVESEETIGIKIFNWEAQNDKGGTVSSGIYFARIECSNLTTDRKDVFTRKLILLK